MTRTRLTKPFLALSLAFTMLLSTVLPAFGFLDKTRFAADLGIAYYCYHHWIAKPMKEGKFRAGAPKRTSTIVKAGVATLFAVHFIKAANKIAHSSKDKNLRKLSIALDGMAANFGTIGKKFKGKSFADGDIKKLDGSYNGVDTAAKAQGLTIKDKVVKVPGLTD